MSPDSDLVASLGGAGDLVGVTRYCTDGAPDTAERIGGTKNPDVQRIVALRPDLVLANTEENRPDDLLRLREAGLTVEEAMELADLSSFGGKGYLMAVDRHDVYGECNVYLLAVHDL